MKKISEALDQYTGICKEAILTSAVKLSKRFEKVIIEEWALMEKNSCFWNIDVQKLNERMKDKNRKKTLRLMQTALTSL